VIGFGFTTAEALRYAWRAGSW